MSERKHTPGPWTPMVRQPASRADNGLCALAQVWGGWIVVVPSWMVDRSGYDAEANARLIAAAPELLEALLAIEEAFVTDHGALNQTQIEAIRLVDAAIAKATGANH